MPFVFWNVSDVTVSNFLIKDPPLWSLNIMNGTDLVFENITANATATQAPYGKNWVQNTDGFDTMDVNNARLTNCRSTSDPYTTQQDTDISQSSTKVATTASPSNLEATTSAPRTSSATAVTASLSVP